MNDIDLDELRQRAEERVHAKRQFSLHAVVFGIGMVVMWVLWAIFIPFDEGIVFLPALITIGWIVALAVHGLATLQKLRIEGVAPDDDVKREMAREMRLRGIDPSVAIPDYMDEKPKRSGEKTKSSGTAMRLSDDGELIEVDPAEQNGTSANHRSPNGHM